MEMAGETVLETLERQGGVLSAAQQRDIVELYYRLDEADTCIIHNDANPRNLMFRRGVGDTPDRWYLIDYGMSRYVTAKDAHYPNLRSIDRLLHSGIQGLITTGALTAYPELLLRAAERDVDAVRAALADRDDGDYGGDGDGSDVCEGQVGDVPDEGRGRFLTPARVVPTLALVAACAELASAYWLDISGFVGNLAVEGPGLIIGIFS